jgi:TonB family protein
MPVESALIGGGGMGPGLPSGLLDRILTPPTTAPPPLVEKPKPVAKPAEPAPTPRVRVGGDVLPPRLLRQIQPIYPSIARTARVGGTVELQGVIGADGRVRELRVVSGSPLLTRAAVDAVSQWLYAPTRLNGQIVEVITKITVRFQLQ